MRRALLGDGDASGGALKAAENPLDLLLARGWISREAHEAGRAFAGLHARARLSAAPVRTSRLERGGRSAPSGGDPAALWRMNEIWAGAPMDAHSALIDLCVLEAWPLWLVRAAQAQEPAVRNALLAGPGKRALDAGLARVGEVLRMRTPEGLNAGSDLSMFVALGRR